MRTERTTTRRRFSHDLGRATVPGRQFDAETRASVLQYAVAYVGCLLPLERQMWAEIAGEPVAPSPEIESWLVRVETPYSFVLVRIDLDPQQRIRSICHLRVDVRRRRRAA